MANERKTHIDQFGAAMLLLTSALFGVNQALVKLVNSGMDPVFQAGLRSLCAIFPLLLFAIWRGKKLGFKEGTLIPGILCGIFFAAEFWLLFNALEYTTVSRSAVLFYTMPVWVSFAAHWLIPGEVLTPKRLAGLLLAVAGVAIALLRNEAPATDQAFIGDLMALTGSFCWAGIALTARLSNFSKTSPEMQMIYQLIVSAPILLGLAFLGTLSGGELFREMTPALWGIFAFQVLVVVAFGFALWFWVLSIYPSSNMASFAFLTPLFSVFFGWLFFNEQLTVTLVVALTLVGAGIYLVNRK
ncbi:MAG: DMT family transporter [Salaquimonas sp.]